MTDAAGNGTALEVIDLHKSFGNHEVLRGVSLVAEKGDVISILGASGSGKSTFLRCINHLEEVNGGVLLVDGEFGPRPIESFKDYETYGDAVARQVARACSGEE